MLSLSQDNAPLAGADAVVVAHLLDGERVTLFMVPMGDRRFEAVFG